MKKQNDARAQVAATPRRKRADGVRTLSDLKGRCVIDDETGCWLWQGAISHAKTRKVRPIPRVWLSGDLLGIPQAARVLTAAKAAWLLAGKPLADGHIVWRCVCSNNLCTNPAHGKGTERAEMHRALAASNRIKGNPLRAVINERNRSMTLIQPEVVREAEAMFAAGRMQKEVKAAMGLSNRTLQLIRTGLHPNSAGRRRLVRGASVFSLGGWQR